MNYKGKIGIWWYCILIFLGLLTVGLVVERSKANSFIVAITALLILDIWFLDMTFRNYVRIEEEKILVVLGIFKQTINCNKVYSIKKSKNPLASMALSFDRLGIIYRNGYCMIAIKNKEDFINEVKKINNRIKIENQENIDGICNNTNKNP